MAWSLQEATSHLATWMEAERSVATGQSYKIGSRSLTRASLKEIRERISFWRNEIARLSACRPAGVRARRAVPRDL